MATAARAARLSHAAEQRRRHTPAALSLVSPASSAFATETCVDPGEEHEWDAFDEADLFT